MSSCADEVVSAATGATVFGDDEVTIDRTLPPPPPPPKAYSAVFRALGRLYSRSEALKTARAAKRVGKVENLAEDCVHHWLIAQVARRRLEQLDALNCHVESAQDAVDGAARLLTSELRPMEHMPGPTRKHLARLRLSIRLAMNARGQGRKRQPSL